MPSRSRFLDSQEPAETYEVGAESAIAIIEALLRIVLAFIPDPAEAKGQVDRVAAVLANEAAEAAEDKKFGRY